MYLNKVQIIGNITKDIELKAIPSGQSVVNFSVATNRTWKNAQGEKQENVDYHNIVAFGKQAEVIKQYCAKGDQIYVEGRLQTRTWETQDGQKRYATEIMLENFQFGKKSDKNQEKKTDYETQVDKQFEQIASQEVDTAHKTHDPETNQDISLDDIPFS